MLKTQSKKLKKLRITCINTDFSATPERQKANVYGGVAYYRLVKPILELDEFDITFKSSDMSEDAKNKTVIEFFDELTKKADIIVTKCIDNPEAASNLIFFCKRNNTKLILDLDDNLFEVKPDQPAYKYYGPKGEKRPIVSALLSMVDALFVSTQPLADYYGEWLKRFNREIPIFVLPNYNDIKDFDFPVTKNETDKIILGWVGSTTHNEDLMLALPAIKRLLIEYPTLEFNLVGGLTNEWTVKLFSTFPDEVLDRVYTSGGTIGWKGYPEMLMGLNWDIGIAPVTQHEFNRGKSPIKWYEMAMKHIPCVASKVYPYWEKILDQDSIIDGKTGLLADEKEWYKQIKKLIDNKELRKEIGENAYKYVSENLQYENHRHLWVEALEKVSTIDK